MGDIDVLSFGDGPGLVVLPGNFRRAHHYATLARALAETGPVHVVERRGRGASGPRRPGYTVEHEVDDVLEVLDRTGSSRLFGHSYGGLIALHAGLRRPLDLITAYEPGVMFADELDWPWLPEFTRLVAAGRQVAAMTVFLRGAGLTPIPASAPTIAFRLLALLLCRTPGSAENRELIPTMPAELAEIARLASDGARYAAVGSPTVLLGGTRSPAYVTRSLAELPRIMPNARGVLVDGLEHNAPDESAPDEVARVLLAELSSPTRP
jgi:pimeloyl-ACP methyl ester carboxylesterase